VGTYKKQKKSLPVMLVSVQQTILNSKIITKITENHSEFSGWAHKFNKSVSIRS